MLFKIVFRTKSKYTSIDEIRNSNCIVWTCIPLLHEALLSKHTPSASSQRVPVDPAPASPDSNDATVH